MPLQLLEASHPHEGRFSRPAAEATTFFTLLGLSYWQIIVGLIIGGVLAAPLAAYACKKLPPRILMVTVGAVVTALSIRNLYPTLIP